MSGLWVSREMGNIPQWGGISHFLFGLQRKKGGILWWPTQGVRQLSFKVDALKANIHLSTKTTAASFDEGTEPGTLYSGCTGTF